MTTFLRRLIIAGLFSTLLAPFVILNDFFFPFITGKAFFFRIVVEIIFSAWIVLMLLDARYRPKLSYMLYAFAGFIAVMTLADFFGANVYKSFWSNFERMEGLFLLFHLFAYFLVLGTMFTTEKMWNSFFKSSLAVSIALCVFRALPQLYGGSEIYQSSTRIDGTFGNAAYFAAYLLLHIFVALFFLVRSQKNAQRVMYAIALFVQMYILYFTQTRGAILGLIGGLGVASLVVAIGERQHKKIRMVAISGLVLVALAVVGFYSIRTTSFVQSQDTLKRLSEISLNKQFLQSQGRYYVWAMAVKGFTEHPILGWGQENFNYVFNEHYDPGMYGQEQWFDRTHNVVLDWLIAGGALGLLSYLSLYIAALYMIWRTTGKLSVADRGILTGLLAAHFFQNLFVFDNLTSYMILVSVLAYVYAIQTPATARVFLASYKPRETTVQTIIAPIVLVVMCVVMYAGVIRPAQANMSLIDALTPLPSGQYDAQRSFDAYQKALSYNTVGIAETREQLVFFAQRIADDATVPIELREKIFNLAASEMKKQVAENQTPDARHHLFLGSVLARYGAFDEAMSNFNKALELSPNKQTIYFEMVSAYLAKGDMKSALEIAKKAFDLAPSFEEARVKYFIVAIAINNMQLADSLKDGISEQVMTTDNRILNAYMFAKQYPRVIEILKNRVSADPQNPQLRLSLAAGYLEAGQREASIGAIQDFVKLDPAKYTAQGDYLISEIRAGRNPTKK